MSTVQMQSVSKRFETLEAVTDLSFTAQDEEILALMGPSGSGKTTALRLIAGLEMPDSGEIMIGDRRVSRLPSGKRDVAMMVQGDALFPHMSVYENLSFGLRSRGIARADIDKRAREIASELDIEALLGRKPRRLSGGQRQRVALGRAIAVRPSVFLLDEPFSRLDPELRTRTRTGFGVLQRHLRTTTILVTHDGAEAMALGTRIVILRGGTIEQIGTPTEVYLSPHTVFVATLIGTPPMSLLSGHLAREDGQLFLHCGGLRLILPDALEPRARTTDNVIVGIRADDVHIIGPDADSDGPLLQVKTLEYQGHETIAYLVVGPHLLAARLPKAMRPSIGDRVQILLDADHLHLFDGETGRRLATSGPQTEGHTIAPCMP